MWKTIVTGHCRPGKGNLKLVYIYSSPPLKTIKPIFLIHFQNILLTDCSLEPVPLQTGMLPASHSSPYVHENRHSAGQAWTDLWENGRHLRWLTVKEIRNCGKKLYKNWWFFATSCRKWKALFIVKCSLGWRELFNISRWREEPITTVSSCVWNAISLPCTYSQDATSVKPTGGQLIR